MSQDFQDGKAAAVSGKARTDNPFICGTTKLGSPKFSDFDRGSEWDNGFTAGLTPRVASKEEVEAADRVNVSQFRRKPNRYYR